MMLAHLSMWVLAAAISQAPADADWLKAIPADVDVAVRMPGPGRGPRGPGRHAQEGKSHAGEVGACRRWRHSSTSSARSTANLRSKTPFVTLMRDFHARSGWHAGGVYRAGPGGQLRGRADVGGGRTGPQDRPPRRRPGHLHLPGRRRDLVCLQGDRLRRVRAGQDPHVSHGQTG